MKAFHNDQTIKDKLLANLLMHKKLDNFKQGDYWDDEDKKGCAVGCSLIDFGGNPYNHKDYERLFGIPIILAKLEDSIFEGLSVDDSKWWPIAFTESINSGSDLSMVWPKFALWILEDSNHGIINYANNNSLESINKVIELYKRTIYGENIDIKEWRSAASAASAADYADYAYAAYADYASAASASAAAADYADYASASAADASAISRQARKIQAEKLIEILRETT